MGLEEKEHSLVDRTQLPCPDRVIAQRTKGRIKKIAREKGKAQEVVKSERAQEVSKKRKFNNEMLLISDENVHKRLCANVGEQEGGANLFDETTVTVE